MIAYTLANEENFLMFFKSKLVEGDIRSFLKEQEKETLFSVWRKQQRQVDFLRNFQDKLWNWARMCGSGLSPEMKEKYGFFGFLLLAIGYPQILGYTGTMEKVRSAAIFVNQAQ